MFAQMKYFIIKINFHNFVTDTDHRKLRMMMVQTSVKMFFSKYMRGHKFQTTCINQMNSSLLQTFLRKKYAALMDAYNFSYIPHSTRFLKLLKESVPGLNDSKLHGVNYVSIREETGKDTEELLNPGTLFDMIERISKEIRIKLKNVKNEFNGSFMEEPPLPCELPFLLNLFMNGSNHEEPDFSLPVKALAQIILYNHRIQVRRRKSSGEPHQRHNADKEFTFLLYIGLKVFSATRSSEIIDILHAHGLCVFYDRKLRITQGLGEALSQLSHDDDAVISGLLRTALFMVGAKDNVDKNARCTISRSQYHGTSMSLFQLLSSFNDGFERNYQRFVKVPFSRSKNVGELPSFYTDVEEIIDPPQAYYFTVSTVSIPENVSN